ncbi:histone H3 domain-containing protein, partial [Balamuthia mandrillaris]
MLCATAKGSEQREGRRPVSFGSSSEWTRAAPVRPNLPKETISLPCWPPQQQQQQQKQATATQESEDKDKEEEQEEETVQAPDEAAAKTASLRQQTIEELFKTERQYIDDLSRIINVFMAPLKAADVLKEKEIATLFSNIEVLLKINTEFYRTLTTKLKDGRATSDLSIGEVFVSMSDYFKMYSTYCSNHPSAVELLIAKNKNANFAKVLKQIHGDSATRGIELNAYLIKPVQRICKYPLLIRELQKHTPEDHPDRQPLHEAEKLICHIVGYVNDGSRTAQQQRMTITVNHLVEDCKDLVTPTRLFLQEGTFLLYNAANINERPVKVVLFLFNDLLIITKPKHHKYLEEDKRCRNCFTLRAQIPLDALKIVDLHMAELGPSFEIRHVLSAEEWAIKVETFLGQTPRNEPQFRRYVLGTEREEDKASWMGTLKSLERSFQLEKFKLMEHNAQHQPPKASMPRGISCPPVVNPGFGIPRAMSAGPLRGIPGDRRSFPRASSWRSSAPTQMHGNKPSSAHSTSTSEPSGAGSASGVALHRTFSG